jgi:SAM-dependent methyltransferase
MLILFCIGGNNLPQNIYDNENFYNAYLNLRETSTGLNDVLEIPAFRSLLPDDLNNLCILDLGCGFGQACHWYASQGAEKVIGVDISEKMLARARRLYQDDNIEYIRQPLEKISFSQNQFDLVTSSLAFHYIADFKSLLEEIHLCLKKNGYLIFSQEHPIVTAKKLSNGWFEDDNGEKLHWIIDDYQSEGIRKQHWFIDNVIKYHRTIASIMNALIDTGFSIVKVLEPIATLGAERNKQELKNERRRPSFIMIKARKI